MAHTLYPAPQVILQYYPKSQKEQGTATDWSQQELTVCAMLRPHVCEGASWKQTKGKQIHKYLSVSDSHKTEGPVRQERHQTK